MPVKKQVKSGGRDFAITLAKALKFCHLRAAGLALAFCFALAARVFADDPQEILAKARMSQVSQRETLQGQLRHGPTVIPFRLSIDGGNIKYEFTNPSQTLELQLDEKGARLAVPMAARNTP